MQLFAVKKKHYIFAICLRQKLKKTELNRCMKTSELNTGSFLISKATVYKNTHTITSLLLLLTSFTNLRKRLRILFSIGFKQC